MSNNNQSIEVFSFGEPESVLDKGQIIDYLEAWDAGEWYEPPVSLDGLSRSLRDNAHHSSTIFVKRNILASTFVPTKYLSFGEFQGLALDYLVLDNGYAFLKNWYQPHWFKEDKIHHVFDQDIDQEVYGIPEYIAALQSAWLNENCYPVPPSIL